MSLQIFFAVLLAIHHTVTLLLTPPPCDACFYGICFNKLTVLQGYQPIGQMAIDRTNNLLYLGLKKGSDMYNAIAIGLKTDGHVHHITPNGPTIKAEAIKRQSKYHAKAVDHRTNDVYISDSVSVFKTNPENFQHIELVMVDKHVPVMQFKNKLYYTLNNMHGIIYYENGVQNDIDALLNYYIADFIIDYNEDIYFVSENYAYKYLRMEKKVIKLTDDVNSLFVDRDENAYFLDSFQRTVYKLGKDNKLVEMGGFADGIPYKAVFTSANTIVYSDMDFDGIIYHLVPVRRNCKFNSSTGVSVYD